jgi:hypothetical protein
MRPLERQLPEGVHPFVEVSGEAGYLPLADDTHPEGLYQFVQLARGDPQHVGLLDRLGQRLLAPGLEEGGEVRPLAERGDFELWPSPPRPEGPRSTRGAFACGCCLLFS